VAYFQAPKTTSQGTTKNHALTINPPQKGILKNQFLPKPPPKTQQSLKSHPGKQITKTLT